MGSYYDMAHNENGLETLGSSAYNVVLTVSKALLH